MAQALFYSSNAVSMILSAAIASGDTVCTLTATTGLPASFPFKLLIDWGAATQEVVHCTGLSGLTATIVRGQDGTSAKAHSLGAAVVHGVSAREFNDIEAHVGATSAVHGLAGSVVGTSDPQTLTNKTLDATNSVVKAAVAGAPAGVFVGTTDAQTLTNKTLDATNSVAKAAVVGAPVGAFVGTTDAQSLSAKTLDATSTIGGVSGTTLAADHAAWTAYTPTFTNVTSGVGVFRYLVMGKTMFIRGQFSGGTVTANGTISISIPFAAFGQNEVIGGVINGGTTHFQVPATTTFITSGSSPTAGTALLNSAFSGVIELA